MLSACGWIVRPDGDTLRTDAPTLMPVAKASSAPTSAWKKQGLNENTLALVSTCRWTAHSKNATELCFL